MTGRVLARIEGFAYRVNSLGGQRYEVFIFGIDKWERYGKSFAPVKVVYEFYRDEPNLPEKFFDFSSRYALTVVRDTKCDESVKSLSYEENVSESGKPLPATYVLKVLDGAPTDVLKPDLSLPCFVLLPGQYKVVSEGQDSLTQDGWSPPVNGLQARLGLARGQVLNGTLLITTYLELRNVANVANVMEVPLNLEAIQFEVVDDQDKLLAHTSLPYDELTVELGMLRLPHDSYLRFDISHHGAGVGGEFLNHAAMGV